MVGATTIPAGIGSSADRPRRLSYGTPIVQMDQVLRDVVVQRAVGALAASDISTIDFDHRRVTPGSLFCCVRGEHHDGHRFAEAAVRRGAVGLVVERQLALAVPQAVVGAGQVRAAMAAAACQLWGHPSRTLTTVGVTGTNGKTSVTHLVAAVLGAAGRPTSVIGTLSGARTTPEAPDLQRQLAAALADGWRAAAVEVSSHALVQLRVRGTRFAVGVFTNLAHDHLDFHGTMDRYFEVKASLFEQEECRQAVLNADDPWVATLGRRLAGRSQPLAWYSAAEASDVAVGVDYTRFVWRHRPVRLALPGAFQVANALAAAHVGLALGMDEAEVVEGLGAAGRIPGRFEVVAGPPEVPVTVVVDFAHTPAALTVALASARAIAGRSGRVLCVFGCGGDRDHDKRAPMGAAALEGADLVVVTSDNARSEDPALIAAAVTAGIDAAGRARTTTVLDRAAAIAEAVSAARHGDVVLIAGKGHETTQDIGGRVLAFDDRQVAAHVVADRFGVAL
ncbi:MAG: UDP-N-acetylmuramoyl-L-alanyl-D-glutamate--2,6-diaminopimelate ligase [Actinomycetota bacterium]|nr:UDP-N-acetylmuramoyl-L-alanyl-D-glutamate--2,6-diaminopimelate ligase [Actinomycetota bacterium]